MNTEGMIAGAETSLLLLLRYLRQDFVLSLACCGDSPLGREAAAMGVECHDLPSRTGIRYASWGGIKAWIEDCAALLRIVRKSKPDIIHANNFHAVLVSFPGAFFGRKKLIWHVRDYPHHGLVACVCGCFCKAIVAVSNSIKKALIKKGVAAGKIQVVYNGVEDSGCCSNDAAKSNEEFTFANVGQFVPWKKQGLFIEAAEIVAKQLPGAKFILVGDDVFKRNVRYKNELLESINTSGIAERIYLTGWESDMTEIWPQIDCLVHTADREPFGRVIIEAMANGVPVIAVDSCGPGELIQNEQRGILVEADDPEGLSEAMTRIASMPELAKHLATEGREFVTANLTASKTAEQVAGIYNKIMEN